MTNKKALLGLFLVYFVFVGPVFAIEIGHWNDRKDALIKQDINTASKIGQWTETFVGRNWGIGSWVKGNATDASGKLIWKLNGPKIEKTHPSVFSDTNGDALPDMILTNYRGGTFTLFDVEGLWGSGAEFTCVDTIIEDHFDPIKKTYEYGFVNGIAENKSLGMVVYIDARVIETSTAGSSHSGELTMINLTIVNQSMRNAIEKHFPKAQIRIVQKTTPAGLQYYKVSFVFRGKMMYAYVTDDGVLANVEFSIAKQELPKTVTETINEKISGQEVSSIKGIYRICSIKSNKWVSIDKPVLVFNVQYLQDDKKKNLLIEHDWVIPRFSSNPKQQWAHDGRLVEDYSLSKKMKKLADKLVSPQKKK